jgi:uncharacterized protein YeaO (DUF488 family)
MAVALKRAYVKAMRSDGTRILVDRLWPRGLNKEAAAVHAWLRELAPSDGLRHWFHARPAQWPQFRKRYLQELCAPPAVHALQELYRLVGEHPKVTLVFASQDEEHNNAVVLKELLEGMRKPPSTTGGRPAATAARARR